MKQLFAEREFSVCYQKTVASKLGAMTDAVGQLSYSLMLRDEFMQRVRKNPAFSMRAFARDLEISPGYLSQVLSDKKVLAEDNAFRISQKLSWDSKRQNLFLNLVKLKQCKDPEFRDHLVRAIEEVSGGQMAIFDIEIDEFRLIADWFHFAILELTTVRGFSFSAQGVASRLGIHLYLAQAAIERLRRMGFLVEKNGRVVKAVETYQIKNIPSRAIKTFHEQMLAKAIGCLESAVDRREYMSLTVSSNDKQMKKAKEMINRFIIELDDHFKKGPKTGVYQIGIQMFQLDKESSK